MSIKIGVIGYGNLGKAVERNINLNKDMELVGIFTRRKVESIKTNSDTKVVSIDEIENWKDKIDILILCGGSATDLPEQSPKYAEMFNIIDSFDTHIKIPEHFINVDKAAKKGKKVALISCGWDPGLFSLNRFLAESILPVGKTETFWGKGVSQGHSEALRKIKGIKDAIQYTIPNKQVIEKIKNGEKITLTERDKHERNCFVVLEEGANKKEIEEKIKNMPYYFKEYNTQVKFISYKELKEKHSKMPHGGKVIRVGNTGENKQIIEYTLDLQSNPEFTSCVLLSFARAVYRLFKKGETGAKTILDIPPVLLATKEYNKLLQELL